MPVTYDPQLHILRSVVNSVANQKERHEAQSARHKLFSALEAGDQAGAQDWLEALEVALRSLTTPLDVAILASADRAIGTIRRGLTEQKQKAQKG